MNTAASMFSLEGMAAIVTGAARGNGRAMAEGLGGAGAALLLVDKEAGLLAETAEALTAQGLSASALALDITQDDAPERIADFAVEAFGRIDVLVNNAGITLPHPSADYPDDAWDQTYQVNLRAPFRLSRAVAGRMKAQRSGSIINITSLSAELAFPDNPAYVAFKGALKQLGKALALDLAPFGIRVNNLGPGYIHTEMTRKSFEDPPRHEERAARSALNRWGEPEDLQGPAIFLASPASAFVTGQDLYVDGGWMIKGL